MHLFMWVLPCITEIKLHEVEAQTLYKERHREKCACMFGRLDFGHL